jgi:indolepyruvate ferredoxin oxidoreductase alpha subunit
VKNVDVVDPVKDPRGFAELLQARLASNDLSVIVSRRPCILAAADIRQYEKQNAEKAAQSACAACGGDDA